MDALLIVEAFDVLEQVSFGLLSGCAMALMNQLGFERMKEAFCRGIVGAVGGLRHARYFRGDDARAPRAQRDR